MRVTMSTLGLIGCALLVAGCGRQPAATTNIVNASSVANDMAVPMNDASAMETATNASIAPPPAANSANSAGTAPLGETDGGDTGGNTVQSNVSGM